MMTDKDLNELKSYFEDERKQFQAIVDGTTTVTCLKQRWVAEGQVKMLDDIIKKISNRIYGNTRRIIPNKYEYLVVVDVKCSIPMTVLAGDFKNETAEKKAVKKMKQYLKRLTDGGVFDDMSNLEVEAGYSEQTEFPPDEEDE